MTRHNDQGGRNKSTLLGGLHVLCQKDGCMTGTLSRSHGRGTMPGPRGEGWGVGHESQVALLWFIAL